MKIKIQIPSRIRPKTPASEGKRQSGPSLGTPPGEGGQEQIKKRPLIQLGTDAGFPAGVWAKAPPTATILVVSKRSPPMLDTSGASTPTYKAPSRSE